MNIDKLKGKVLQLAIQGKLVPQNEEDIPASVLLEEIRKEKEQLIKDKKIKKEKPLQEIIEDEKPFCLPKGWEFSRLNQIYRFIDYRGKTPNKIEKGIPLVTAKNVRSGYIDYSIEEFIAPEEFEERKSRGIPQKGDILFTTEAPMGNVAIADLDIFSVGQRLITLQQYSKNDLLVNKLFMYFIMSKTFQNELMEKKTGTTVYGIKAEKLKKLLLPVPPLREQKRIVEKVEGLFSIIDNLNKNKEEMLKNISNTRNKVLQLAIQGKLVEQNENDTPASVLLEEIKKEKEELMKEKKIKKEKALPEITEEEKFFELPKGWGWCKLGEIGYTNIGLTYNPKDIVEVGIPVLRSTNIQNSKIDLNDLVCVQTDIPENKMCKIGDILICARNGSKHLVGKCAIIKENGMSFGAFMAIYRSKYNEYINIILNSELFKKQLGDSNTVTIKQITQTMLRNIVCPLPPLEEQKRIVSKVDEIMDYLDELEKVIL